MFELFEDLMKLTKNALKDTEEFKKDVESGKEINPSQMGEHPVLMNYRDFIVQEHSGEPIDMYAIDPESMKKKNEMYGFKERINKISDTVLDGKQSHKQRFYEKQ